MRTFDPAELPFSAFHRLMVGGIAPRPIAFVSSMDSDGHNNLAPFSFFNAFGVNPPVICFSPAFAGRTGLPKDTFLNILETKECTVSIVTYDMVHQTSLASAPYTRGVDEFAKAGFTKRTSVKVAPPGVAESPFVMEAKLLHHIEFGGKPGSANMLICEVVMLHVNEAVMNEQGSIDPALMDQVARMGGPWYTRAKEGLFKLPQPQQAMLGIDSLPEELRTSTVLTGSDLAKLASCATTPEWKSSVDETSMRLRHEQAKQALAKNDPEAAWKILGS